MSTIKTTERLLKRACLTNLFIGDKGIAITPLLSGTFGVGKSAICKKVAKDLGGIAITIECSAIKEGEITGLPYPLQTATGEKEVRFIPYFQTARIQALEKEIYAKAKKGFLNGSVILLDDGSIKYIDKDGEHIIPAKKSYEKIINGTDNQYEFGEDLPTHIKLALLKSGEIMPVLINFDEINRCSSETMKEFMNILLTRIVNGYKFPWWVFMVGAINPCGQDSMFSTNEMDDAQLDRFLKIKVDADLNEWVDYAIDNNLNSDYITALSTAEEVFQTNGKGYSDNYDTINPSPRSHEICSYIYATADDIMNSGFFAQEDAQFTTEDTRTLIIGKIGSRAGRVILANLKNKEIFIDPAELITGKADTISTKLATKINGMKTVEKHVLTKRLIKYIASECIKKYYDQGSRNANTVKEAKLTWAHCVNQIKDFYKLLDGATQYMFAQSVYKTNVNITDTNYEKYNKETIFRPLVGIFSMDIISQITEINNMVKTGDIDKK